MFKSDNFSVLDIPNLPKRVRVPENYSIRDLEQLRRFPTFQPSKSEGHVILTVAYPNQTTALTPVLFIETLTHIHRKNLDHYILEQYLPTDDGTVWHVGAIEIPIGLTSPVGIIKIPKNAFDSEQQPGADRESYRNLLNNVEPAWTSGEVLQVGTRQLNPLQNAAPTIEGTNKAGAQSITAPANNIHGQFANAVKDGVDVWLHLPETDEVENLLIVTDGHIYIKGVQLLDEYDPGNTAVIFVSPCKEEQRADLLADVESLSSTLKEHILPWAAHEAQKRNTTWQISPQTSTITGGSLGGSAAAGLVLKHPELALNAVIQSAAFWWPDREYALLNEWVEQSKSPDSHKRVIFHEYGKYDVHLFHENQAYGELLKIIPNITCSTRVYNGGHDYLSWRQGIAEGHRWIVNQRKQF